MENIIHVNEEEVKSQLSEMVRKSVEDTLNAMLDAEADQITQAHRYEPTDQLAESIVSPGVAYAQNPRHDEVSGDTRGIGKQDLRTRLNYA